MNKLDFELNQLKRIVVDLNLGKTGPEMPEHLREAVVQMCQPVPSIMQNECAQCNRSLRMWSTAGLTIEYAGLKFCCDCCLEEWMDDKDDECKV